MRPSFAILCLALALTGCRGNGGGFLSRMTIPPPGTQPPGALLADNAYYPRPDTASANKSATPSPTLPVPPSTLPADPLSFTPVAERRGAAIARSMLAAPARTPAPAATAASREEPIRIPDNSASVGTLASVVRIKGIPTTDATGLFQTVRTQLQPPASLAARTAASGFVEISQLPDAPPSRLR